MDRTPDEHSLLSFVLPICMALLLGLAVIFFEHAYGAPQERRLQRILLQSRLKTDFLLEQQAAERVSDEWSRNMDRAVSCVWAGLALALPSVIIWVVTENLSDGHPFLRWVPGHLVWHSGFAVGLTHVLAYLVVLRADNHDAVALVDGGIGAWRCCRHRMPIARTTVQISRPPENNHTFEKGELISFCTLVQSSALKPASGDPVRLVRSSEGDASAGAYTHRVLGAIDYNEQGLRLDRALKADEGDKLAFGASGVGRIFDALLSWWLLFFPRVRYVLYQTMAGLLPEHTVAICYSRQANFLLQMVKRSRPDSESREERRGALRAFKLLGEACGDYGPFRARPLPKRPKAECSEAMRGVVEGLMPHLLKPHDPHEPSLEVAVIDALPWHVITGFSKLQNKLRAPRGCAEIKKAANRLLRRHVEVTTVDTGQMIDMLMLPGPRTYVKAQDLFRSGADVDKAKIVERIDDFVNIIKSPKEFSFFQRATALWVLYYCASRDSNPVDSPDGALSALPMH